MAARYLQEIVTELGNSVTQRQQTLPEYLRQLRISNKYRQSFVASRLNISRQTYSHYETGRIRPPAGALYGLAKLYEVPVENLLSCMMIGQYGIENQKEKQGNLKYEDMNEMERQLLSSFRSLNKIAQKDILSTIELKIQNAERKS